MKNIKIEKIISIALIMGKYNYKMSDIINKRIINYDFEENTTIKHNDKYIKISTETSIKGVNNVLLLFPNGMSKVDFEFI